MLTNCLNILNEGGNIAPLNHTYVALIPKVEKPRQVTEFRPINLCNVIYRIITKTIANRLKHMLHNIISQTQSAFILGRLIANNVVIGYKCLHKIRLNKEEKKGLVALKLDISKAYDRIKWGFLENVMKRLGFSPKWIDLIMRCISTVSFSILINGAAKGMIHSHRGLRQGCPLSRYLFIFYAEGFSNLFQQVECQKLI